MIWSRSSIVTGSDCVIAGVLTAAVPVGLAFALYWLAPWGCDASAWICLFPLSLLGVAPVAALCLPILFHFNRRRRQPFPDGWLPVILLTGSVSQLLVTGYSLWTLADYMRRIFLYDALIFPQGFAAGATAGAVFWVSLALLGRMRKRSK